MRSPVGYENRMQIRSWTHIKTARRMLTSPILALATDEDFLLNSQLWRLDPTTGRRGVFLIWDAKHAHTELLHGVLDVGTGPIHGTWDRNRRVFRAALHDLTGAPYVFDARGAFVYA